MKKTPSIDFLLDFTKQYIDGKISELDFRLDFPYELEKRYKSACRENPEYTELIYDMLLEEGIYKREKCNCKEFQALIKRQFEELQDITDGGFL